MSPIDPSLRIGDVRLAVSDLGASSDFYERALGLEALERDGQRTLLGTPGGLARLELRAIERPTPAPRHTTGLFHVAWLHPSRAALAETVRRVAAHGRRFDGAADHGVSEALYLSDPDGLGIEIYADRPRASWRRPADGSGVAMVTDPLDLDDLMGAFSGEPAATIAPGTTIGHVHLKVADVDASAAFYERLGFEEQARMPSAAFVSAGGYHHHLGLNSWMSAGGPAAGQDSPGLRRVGFRLSGRPALAALARAAGESEPAQEARELLLSDPDGQALSFTVAEG